MPRAVLDIGCGDGRVTAGALTAATTWVELVEPSAALLDRAVASLERPGVEIVAHRSDAATFVAALHDTASWDLVQSTFALHATPPDERAGILQSLRRHTPHLALVEFDIPAFTDRSPEQIAYLAERYEHGVREYRAHPEVIAEFLMPVLVGQLDPAIARYTFEQPIDAWIQLIRSAGFATSTRRIARYWWADAVLISATTESKS
jgi:SAM-dependent methyltransferase